VLFRSKLKEKPNRFAIIVAIEDYRDTAKVPYALKTAQAITLTLNQVQGVPKSQTYLLMNEQATVAGISNRIKHITQLMNANDELYFYFVGHGLPSPQNGDPYMLPYDLGVDLVIQEPAMKLENIYQLLGQTNGQTYAFMDSCFSGQSDGQLIFQGVAPGLLRRKQIELSQTAKPENLTIITAGTNEEFANAYTDRGYRLFGYYLAENLISYPNAKIKDLYPNLKDSVLRRSQIMGPTYRQTPQMY